MNENVTARAMIQGFQELDRFVIAIALRDQTLFRETFSSPQPVPPAKNGRIVSSTRL